MSLGAVRVRRAVSESRPVVLGVDFPRDVDAWHGLVGRRAGECLRRATASAAARRRPSPSPSLSPSVGVTAVASSNTVGSSSSSSSSSSSLIVLLPSSSSSLPPGVIKRVPRTRPPVGTCRANATAASTAVPNDPRWHSFPLTRFCATKRPSFVCTPVYPVEFDFER